jgi:hypothetical protein
VPTELVRIATLEECDLIDRFFTTPYNPNMGHSLRHFIHNLHEKGHIAWFIRKMPFVRIKHDKVCKDYIFFSIYIN